MERDPIRTSRVSPCTGKFPLPTEHVLEKTHSCRLATPAKHENRCAIPSGPEGRPMSSRRCKPTVTNHRHRINPEGVDPSSVHDGAIKIHLRSQPFQG